MTWGKRALVAWAWLLASCVMDTEPDSTPSRQTSPRVLDPLPSNDAGATQDAGDE